MVFDRPGGVKSSCNMKMKAMTIRLSAKQAAELETVATVDERPVSEVVRAAIAHHIHKRKQDPEFRDGLRSRISRAQRMLG